MSWYNNGGDPDNFDRYGRKYMERDSRVFPKFCDMLPCSIETVRLYLAEWSDDMIVPCLEELFAFSLQEREVDLPYWREFVLVKRGAVSDAVDSCVQRLKAIWNDEPDFSFTIRSIGPGETIESVSESITAEGRDTWERSDDGWETEDGAEGDEGDEDDEGDEGDEGGKSEDI